MIDMDTVSMRMDLLQFVAALYVAQLPTHEQIIMTARVYEQYLIDKQPLTPLTVIK